MKKNRLFGLLSFLLIIGLTISCSKDKDEDKEVVEATKIEFDSEEVMDRLPDGLTSSDNEYAGMAVDYVESAMDWSGFIDNMEPPDNAEILALKSAMTKKSYKWSWSWGGYSYAFYWDYSDDATKKYWNMDIQYNNGPRYKYIEAWEAKSGVKGELKYNFQWACASDETDDCEDLYLKYTWEKNSSNAYVFKYIYESLDDTYEYFLSYDVVVNEDGSGYVKYYSLGQLFYDIQWDHVGNGSWKWYIGGIEFESGSWTVG